MPRARMLETFDDQYVLVGPGDEVAVKLTLRDCPRRADGWTRELRADISRLLLRTWTFIPRRRRTLERSLPGHESVSISSRRTLSRYGTPSAVKPNLQHPDRPLTNRRKPCATLLPPAKLTSHVPPVRGEIRERVDRMLDMIDGVVLLPSDVSRPTGGFRSSPRGADLPTAKKLRR